MRIVFEYFLTDILILKWRVGVVFEYFLSHIKRLRKDLQVRSEGSVRNMRTGSCWKQSRAVLPISPSSGTTLRSAEVQQGARYWLSKPLNIK